MQPSGSSRLQYFPANAGTCSFSCSTLTWCQVFSQQTTLQSPVRAQHFGMSLELWNMTCFEYRNYTLSLWETVLKKSWMFRLHQTPSEVLFQIFLQSFENKKKTWICTLGFVVWVFLSFSSTKIQIFASVWYIPELCIQLISLMHEYLWAPQVKAGDKCIISCIVRLTPTLVTPTLKSQLQLKGEVEMFLWYHKSP